MVYKKSVIADTIHGNITLTGLEKRIMSHVTFNRLHDVYQNSTVYMTFPCNRTKRFEHSLGTMKLCSDMFCAAMNNSESQVRKDFLKFHQEKLKEILAEVKTKKYRVYDNVLGGRIKKINKEKLPHVTEQETAFLTSPMDISEYCTTYFILLQAIRIAALLHDIGHPPYSHITEFALGDVRELYKVSVGKDRILEYNEIMENFFGKKDKKLHEQMGDKIVSIILEDSIGTISEAVANTETEIFDRQVVEILIKEVVEKILTNAEFYASLHRIIDGTLDGDRLDYVTRDSINSGLDRGKIEYERLCNGMTLTEYDNGFWICPSIKALNTVEDFLIRRWDIYKNIIFHHRVIKTDYLLQNVIKEISIAYLNNQIEGENQEDSEDLLPADISGLWKALRASTNIDSSYAISQWDDAWLMTVLKKHYFKDYIDGGSNSKVTKQLQELLTNKKHYFSVVKRLEDFMIMDNELSTTINEYSNQICYQISELKKISKEYKGEKTAIITIDPFLNEIEKILSLSKAISENQTFQGLIFSHLRKSYIVLNNSDITLNIFLDAVVQESREKFPADSVEDVFVVIKNYDIGIKKPLLFYNEAQKRVVSVHNVSSVARILDLSYDTFPQFFIYVLKTELYKDKIIGVDKFLKEIGKRIAVKFCDSWIYALKNEIEKYSSGG